MPNPAPHISEELIEFLERCFDPHVPRDPEDFEVYLTRVGEQRVIRKLREERRRQVEKALGASP